jgi:hypothetical protein
MAAGSALATLRPWTFQRRRSAFASWRRGPAGKRSVRAATVRSGRTASALERIGADGELVDNPWLFDDDA